MTNTLTRERSLPAIPVDDQGRFTSFWMFPLALGVSLAASSLPLAVVVALIGHYMLYSLNRSSAADIEHKKFTIWGTSFAWGIVVAQFITATDLLNRFTTFHFPFMT